MFSRFLVLSVVAVSLALGGCVSTRSQVQRVPDQDLILGRTTKEEIVARMGTPGRESVRMENDKEIQVLAYVYATMYTNDAQITGTPAARSQSFSFHEDVLVGHQFMSSFKSASTDFDDTVVESFKEGETTRADVIAALGRPTGRWIYPMVDEPGDEGIGYAFSFVDTRKAGIPRLFKRLNVVLGPDDVVRKIELDVQEPS